MNSAEQADSGDPKTVAEASFTKPDRASNWRCWLWTTSGAVLMLLLVQLITGLLLAFYYVPATDHAYTTVTFIEKVLPGGKQN